MRRTGPVDQNQAMAPDDPFRPAGLIRAIAHRLLWTMAQAFQQAANACMYAATGLLRWDEFRAATLRCWDAYNAAQDESEASLDGWEREFYGAWLRPADRVLLIGCGTGRDLIALLEAGYHQVTGLDPSPVAVERAALRVAHRGLTTRLVCGDVVTADLGTEYDAVIFSPTAYAYIPHAAARVTTLARLRRQLASDGRILVTYLTRPRPSPRGLHVAAWVSRLAGGGWHPEPGDYLAREWYGPRLVRYEHAFTPEEILQECEAAGLQVVRDSPLTGRLRGLVATHPPRSAPRS